MKLVRLVNIAFILVVSLGITACGTTVPQVSDTQLTVGLVQSEIEPGVSALKVAQTLGSPNIVKKSPDTDGEIWIYDRISQTRSDASLGINVLGLGSDIAGLLGGSSSQSETSSRSLTIIIKLDTDDTVTEVSYFRSAY